MKSKSYKVGSRLRVQLFSGRVVQGEVTAILNQSAGRKVQILFGNAMATVNPEQIIEVLSRNRVAKRSFKFAASESVNDCPVAVSGIEEVVHLRYQIMDAIGFGDDQINAHGFTKLVGGIFVHRKENDRNFRHDASYDCRRHRAIQFRHC